MELSFKLSFVLKGQNGKEAVFSRPFVNDEKELEFKYCSFFNGRVFLNQEKRAIALKSGKKVIYILLKEENESLFEELMDVRKQILSDLRELTQNFKAGKEPIYAIESGNEEYPFILTTPKILENGQYSVKYNKAIMYFLNEGAKIKGKDISITNYEDLLKTVGQALQNSNLSLLQKGQLDSSTYYHVSVDEVIELL